MPAVERTVLDLTAVVVRLELAAADTPADLHALAGKGIAGLWAAGDRQIGRPAIERRGELTGRNAGAIDDRLVIPGEKPFRVAEPADAQRTEIVLEELARALFLKRHRRNGAHADGPECVRDRRRLRRLLVSPIESAAAFEKGSKSGGVIVGRPAIDIAPIDRLILRVRPFDRLALRAIAGGRSGAKGGDANTGDDGDRKPRSSDRRHQSIIRMKP